MDDVALRAFLPEDVDVLTDIWQAGASLPGVGPAALPTRDELRVRFEETLAATCRIVVAERAGEIVGFAAMKRDEPVLDRKRCPSLTFRFVR